MKNMVTLPDGAKVPAIGQGTWFLGEHPTRLKQEEEALRAGVGAGMTLIDTAEMYGNGKAEELIGKTLPELKREDLFLVSKVYPHNAGRRNIFKSCMASMKRMGVDYLDLYLLHWRGAIPLEERSADGVFPTLIRLIWRSFGAFRAERTVRSTRCSTMWHPVESSTIFCRG